MSRLCIIPARGGSKRIPRKNIKDFLGKPIIAYSVEAALACDLFDEVMVSTDDEEIAGVARAYGAEVPFIRSQDTAGDHATTLDVVKEVLDTYARNDRRFVEVVCLYATAPFVTANLLTRAVTSRAESGCHCVFPALAYSFPVQRSFQLNAMQRISLREPQHVATRSQDLPAVYHDAGMFYCFQPEPVLERGTLWTDDTKVIEVPELEAHDIDTPEDWRIAEFKYRLLHGEA